MKNISKRPVFILSLIFILVIFLRLPLTVCPLYNVDEAIFATMGKSILNGQLIYRDIVEPSAPITFYFYALIFFLFGENNMFAIHVGLLLLILCISFILYLVGNLIEDRKLGYLAAFLFCIFSYTYGPSDMLGLETEWFVALFCSIGTYLLIKYSLKNNAFFVFLGGLSFGLAFFSKQSALFVYPVALLFSYLFAYSNNRNVFTSARAAIFNMFGFFLIPALFLYYFYINNAINEFLFWFWEYHSKYYVPAINISQKLKSAFIIKGSFFEVNYLLLVLFFINLLAVTLNTFKIFYRFRGFDKKLLFSWYLIFWCIFCYIGVSYSGRGFGHYYIMLLPPLCLLGSKTILLLLSSLFFIQGPENARYKTLRLSKLVIGILSAIFLLCGIFLPLSRYSDRLSLWSDFVNRNKRYALALTRFSLLSEYIKKNSTGHDRIFVWGFAPQFYTLTNRSPASRYISANFLTGLIPWVNCPPDIDTTYAIVPGAWEIFMREMNQNKPLYIIDTSIDNYRCYAKYPPNKFKVFSDFLKKNYVPAETVDSSFRLFKRIN